MRPVIAVRWLCLGYGHHRLTVPGPTPAMIASAFDAMFYEILQSMYYSSGSRSDVAIEIVSVGEV